MANITEYLKPQVEALGENKIEASIAMHREKLSSITEKAAAIIEDNLPDATFKDVITAYDVTRKHLNIIDGRSDNQTVNIFVPPPELAAQYSLADEIKARIIEEAQCQQTNNQSPPQDSEPKEQSSTRRKQKSPAPATVSE